MSWGHSGGINSRSALAESAAVKKSELQNAQDISNGSPTSNLPSGSIFSMSLEEIMGLKITSAGKMLEEIGDVPASVMIISRDEIERYGYNTLSDILENIPGLYGINDYAFDGMNFGVRGYWSGDFNRNMVVLVNGINQVIDYNSTNSFAAITVPVEAIEKIEIVRGPMSVLYGSGAFFGVINIITYDKLNFSPQNHASFTGGSHDTYKSTLRLTGESKDARFKFQFDGAIYDTTGIDQPYSRMRDTQFPASWGLTINDRTNDMLELCQKYFNFSSTYDPFTLHVNYTEAKTEGKFVFPSPTKSNGSINDQTSFNVSLNYEDAISDKFSISARAAYFRFKSAFDYELFHKNFQGIQELDSDAYELELNGFYSPQENLNITMGLYNRTIFNVDNYYDLAGFGDPSLQDTLESLNSKIHNRALFTQISYEPISQLRLIAGGRMEQMPEYRLRQRHSHPSVASQTDGKYDGNEYEFISRLGAIYQVNNQNVIKLLYGNGINRPSWFQSMKNVLEPSKGHLQPEDIETIELNYISSIIPHCTTNISIFHNTLDNLITRVSELDTNGNYRTWHSNAGKVVTDGLETTLQYQPTSDLSLEFSGTYQESRNKQSGFKHIDVAYSPNFLGYLKASYVIKSGTILAINGNYVGSMKTYWDDTQTNPDGSIGGRIGNKVNGYFTMGCNLRIEDIFTEEMYLNLRCSNLLNQTIHYPTYTNNPWATNGTIGQGRTFLATLGYRF